MKNLQEVVIYLLLAAGMLIVYQVTVVDAEKDQHKEKNHFRYEYIK